MDQCILMPLSLLTSLDFSEREADSVLFTVSAALVSILAHRRKIV